MSRSTASTQGDARTTKMLAHCGRRDAQLRTDLAQRPTLGVQVRCALNVHRGTLASLSRIVSNLYGSARHLIVTFPRSHQIA